MSSRRVYEIITSIKNLTFERKTLKANAEVVVDKLCDWALELKTMERDGLSFDSMFGRDYEIEEKIKNLEAELKKTKATSRTFEKEVIDNRKIMVESVDLITEAQESAKKLNLMKAKYEANLLALKAERDSWRAESLKLQKELSEANKKLIYKIMN